MSTLVDNLRMLIKNAQKPQVFRKPTLNDFIEAVRTAQSFDRKELKMRPDDFAHLKRLCAECGGLYEVKQKQDAPTMFFGMKIVESIWALPI